MGVVSRVLFSARFLSIDMKTTTCKLLAATLLIGSSLSGVRTVLAQTQTAAGTTISNTATATYSDGTNTYNATSNTVTVQVAEVPGINVAAQTPTNVTPNPNDTLTVDFIVTNVGNDPTQFFIPGTVKLSDTNSYFSIVGALQIVAVDGNAITPVSVPAAGAATGSSALLNLPQGSIAPSGTVTVRATIRVNASAPAGATTTIALGETATANDQNVDRTGNINNTLDVYTVDNPDGTTGETPGVLTRVNEAMSTSSAITVNARLQAFATILKAVSNYSNSNTPAVLSDDTLTYSLALKVATPTPLPAGLVASDLHPTAIDLNGSSQNRILVSDAIPTGTVLSSTVPTAPDSSWTVVYTISNLSIPAHQAAWSDTRPTSGTITRVGFVRSTAIVNNSTPIQGFSFSVNPTATFTGGEIANMAQVFGQSQPGTSVPGTSTQLVYDESGDQAANNQLEGGNPAPPVGVPGTGLQIDDGVADATTDGRDPGRGTSPTAGDTNQGSTTDADGGEVTTFTIATTPLNGPNARPNATYNDDNNQDFTNKTSLNLTDPLPVTTPLTDAQTPATSFNNTVQNTNTVPTTISLLPTPPATRSDLPPDTLVTISNGTDTAVYRYNGTTFGFESGTNTSAANPVKLVDVPAAGQVGYTVTVDLPGSTPTVPILQAKGFPVPIVAFIDQGLGDGLYQDSEPANITIDRVYTGFITLLKDARILDGATPIFPNSGYSTDQAGLSAAARPGRTIEYRIRYENISIAATAAQPGASESIGLPASNFVITENGSVAPNNWAASTVDAVSGTIPGSANDSLTGTANITGTSANGDIQVYVNTVGDLAPGTSGEFIIRRRIK